MPSPFEEAAARVAAGADHHREAAALVAQLTLDEKLGCLDGDVAFWPGVTDMTAGGYYEHPWPAAVVERLGIPGIRFSDGPRGCVVGRPTCFPVSMARGATFDPELEERVGDAIGAELRASGATFTGAVCMNLLRHPAWGRAQETYGEDPHHVGVMAAALTRGLQRHVLACMKHYALNSMENARFTVDVTVDERALHEVYLPHFRRVAAAGVASAMSAYNSVNGEWCGQNRTLLTDILREEWGWDGFVITDFIFGFRDPVASLRAGCDIEMPFRQQRVLALGPALQNGEITEADVDRAVIRVVATLLRFWPVIGRPAPPLLTVASADHVALARDVARRSMVLLRNEDALLPVAPASLRRVAVLGRLAATPNLGDGGSSDVHPPWVVTPLDGLRAALPGVDVLYAEDDVTLADGADLVVVVVGSTKLDEGEFIEGTGMAELMALFPPMDHPAVGTSAPLPEFTRHPFGEAAGSRPSEADEPPAGTMAPGGDRASLRLSAAHEALIDAACARNPRTVVAVMGGSAIVMPWVDRPAATLLLWYPGMEGGAALADVLTGAAEPSGRLPFAVPTEEAHLPYFDREAAAITYDLWHGQWLLDRDERTPAFPFGFGLGYTTFELADAVWDGTSVQVTVRNTSGREGSTVVQVYAGRDGGQMERPIRRLAGFRRVELAAGCSESVTVGVDLDVTAVRSDGAWIADDGALRLEIGFDAAHTMVIA